MFTELQPGDQDMFSSMEGAADINDVRIDTALQHHARGPTEAELHHMMQSIDQFISEQSMHEGEEIDDYANAMYELDLLLPEEGV